MVQCAFLVPQVQKCRTLVFMLKNVSTTVTITVPYTVEGKRKLLRGSGGHNYYIDQTYKFAQKNFDSCL